MKKWMPLFVFILTGLYSCKDESPVADTLTEEHLPTDLVSNPNSLSPSSKTAIGQLVFKDTVHNFGRMKAGEKVNFEFTYTNTGSKDILIYSARASCGCTIPEYNHDTPIKPGESGTIKVNFNSEGKEGHQRKSILVSTSGQPAEHELFIEADIY